MCPPPPDLWGRVPRPHPAALPPRAPPRCSVNGKQPGNRYMLFFQHANQNHVLPHSVCSIWSPNPCVVVTKCSPQVSGNGDPCPRRMAEGSPPCAAQAEVESNARVVQWDNGDMHLFVGREVGAPDPPQPPPPPSALQTEKRWADGQQEDH